MAFEDRPFVPPITAPGFDAPAATGPRARASQDATPETESGLPARRMPTGGGSHLPPRRGAPVEPEPAAEPASAMPDDPVEVARRMVHALVPFTDSYPCPHVRNA